MILEDDSLVPAITQGHKGVATTPTRHVSDSVKTVVDAELAAVPAGHGVFTGRIVSEQGGVTTSQLVIAHRVSKDTWVATWVGKDFSRPGVSWGVEAKVSW